MTTPPWCREKVMAYYYYNYIWHKLGLVCFANKQMPFSMGIKNVEHLRKGVGENKTKRMKVEVWIWKVQRARNKMKFLRLNWSSGLPTLRGHYSQDCASVSLKINLIKNITPFIENKQNQSLKNKVTTMLLITHFALENDLFLRLARLKCKIF